ncbi:hypothetical protein [Hymenobacter cellulosivorans]|uniref:Uncharacterized protein n=1 Tax=Hymenobacter cellulosivorans TaxID=2932249 RepID=A0ABY4F9X6_9BACT|nr:hypothetical protein [Hymenobacter cellulosivorans]UOQ53254.1 hypothetical protein MUN80_00490 [Hymenobacter cellulosivorans]
MTEEKKYALRAVLQHGFKLIAICCASDDFKIYNPASWYRHYQLVKEISLFARWLEKLAFYSAIDFQGFIEEHLWQEYEVMRKQTPTDSFWSIRHCYIQELDRVMPAKD